MFMQNSGGESRSTWACELKYFCKTIWYWIKMSRSTWACELKSRTLAAFWKRYRHAPRERVSWNNISIKPLICVVVTLHVSVWVEICQLHFLILSDDVTLHVSVWVEISDEQMTPAINARHAPRERVSWNIHCCHRRFLSSVTLHVSVWVEMLVAL